jgi:predicted metal-dependent hydrolase
MPEIQITKTWRKTLSMKFDRKGTLQVSAPKFMTSTQIQAFIDKNAAWIEKHHSTISEQKKHKKHYFF